MTFPCICFKVLKCTRWVRFTACRYQICLKNSLTNGINRVLWFFFCVWKPEMYWSTSRPRSAAVKQTEFVWVGTLQLTAADPETKLKDEDFQLWLVDQAAVADEDFKSLNLKEKQKKKKKLWKSQKRNGTIELLKLASHQDWGEGRSSEVQRGVRQKTNSAVRLSLFFILKIPFVLYSSGRLILRRSTSRCCCLGAKTLRMQTDRY